MILIPKDKPWPMEEGINPATGIPFQRRVNAHKIVTAGLHAWISKTGDRPTHIILPIRLRDDFKASLSWVMLMAIEPAFPEQDESEFLGMKLIFSTSKALELLSTLPEYHENYFHRMP